MSTNTTRLDNRLPVAIEELTHAANDARKAMLLGNPDDRALALAMAQCAARLALEHLADVYVDVKGEQLADDVAEWLAGGESDE